MKAALVAAVVGALMAISSIAMAQDKVVYKKHTVIDLSGAVIQGELIKPEGSYIVNRKLSHFSTLIQVRMDFVPELLDSANNL